MSRDDVEFLAFFSTVVASLAMIFGGIAITIRAEEAHWSFAIWRAQRARKRLLDERVAALMAMGYAFDRACGRAEVEMAKEADDQQKAIEQVFPT